MLGGLTVNLSVANFLLYFRAKNFQNWSAVDKVIAIIKGGALFMAHSVHTVHISKYNCILEPAMKI